MTKEPHRKKLRCETIEKFTVHKRKTNAGT